MFLAMLAYMAFITFTSDIRGSCNPGYVETHPDMVTLDERIWAFLSFYLGILTIYNFFCLIRPVKGFKQAIAIFCILFILFDIVMIAYSLITEWDKYVNFEWLDDLYEKPSSDRIIKSFFPIPNVYGHYTYFGIVALVTLSFAFRKYYLVIFSFLLLPFVLYSNSRIALVGTFVLYGAYFVYLRIRSFKYCRIIFYILTGLIILGIIIILIDFNVYNFIKFEMENGTEISLKKVFLDLWDSFVNKRLNIIRDTPVTINNILFGFGYGLQFIIPRTYGFCYYFHNSVYEIFMAGGVPYFIFTSIIFLIVFIKLIYVAKTKRKYNYLGLFLVLIFAQSIYGLFESHVASFNDSTGLILGVFILCIPNILADYELNGCKYYYFNSDIQKTCLTLTYKELFESNYDNSDYLSQNIISFTRKLVVELNLNELSLFIITFDSRSRTIGHTEVEFDELDNVVYVKFK